MGLWRTHTPIFPLERSIKKKLLMFVVIFFLTTLTLCTINIINTYNALTYESIVVCYSIVVGIFLFLAFVYWRFQSKPWWGSVVSLFYPFFLFYCEIVVLSNQFFVLYPLSVPLEIRVLPLQNREKVYDWF